MPEPLLDAQGIVRRYRGANGVLAVRGASLAVAPKDFVAFMGPSGSGKTTFIGIMSGLDRPDEGTVTWKDRDVFAMSREESLTLRRTGMGIVFQSFGLLPTLSAAENVELPLLLTSLSRAERVKHVATALRIVGLEDRMHHYPRQLSGGQEQRVAIARAIVNDPKIIVADEPTGDLDRKSADDVLALMDRLNKELHKTIFMVTHDPAAAERASVQRKLDKGALQ